MNDRICVALAAFLPALVAAAAALAGDGPQATPSCGSGGGNGGGSVLIEYAGTWRDSCIPRNPVVQVVAGTLELHAASSGGFCLTVLTPYTIAASANGLCDGVYHTEVVTHLGNGAVFERIPGPVVVVDCSIADFNNDCAVSVQDIFDLLAAYFANDPRADVNASGSVTVQDVFDYLAAYFGG